MLWRSLACTGVALGAIGAVLPVVPTTPFLLFALWAGARSSPGLRFRLYRHPRYGATLRAWHRHRSIPVGAKLAACLAMALSALVSWAAGVPGPLLAAIALLFAVVGVFLLSRPSRPPAAETNSA